MKKPSLVLLAFALLFPLFQTYLYFDIMADWHPIWQKGIYSATKVVMFLLPLVYLGFFCRERCLVRKFSSRGLLEGSAFGLFVSIGMCMMYYCWLKPLGIVGPGTYAAEMITKRVSTFGISTPPTFILFGCFVSFVHSGLEEYYWRWFSFGLLRRVSSTTWAAIISGVAFSLHHIILLGTYFGYSTLHTWLFSLGIAIGGAYWAWLYARKDSIWAPWLSHAWIDVAIFVLGYDMVFSVSVSNLG